MFEALSNATHSLLTLLWLPAVYHGGKGLYDLHEAVEDLPLVLLRLPQDAIYVNVQNAKRRPQMSKNPNRVSLSLW